MVLLSRHEPCLLGFEGKSKTKLRYKIFTILYRILKLYQPHNWILITDQVCILQSRIFSPNSFFKEILQGVFPEGCMLDVGEMLWVTSDAKLFVVDKKSCEVLVCGQFTQLRNSSN